MLHWSIFYFRYIGDHIIKANGGFTQEKKIHACQWIFFSFLAKHKREEKWSDFLVPIVFNVLCKVRVVQTVQIFIGPEWIKCREVHHYFLFKANWLFTNRMTFIFIFKGKRKKRKHMFSPENRLVDSSSKWSRLREAPYWTRRGSSGLCQSYWLDRGDHPGKQALCNHEKQDWSGCYTAHKLWRKYQRITQLLFVAYFYSESIS